MPQLRFVFALVLAAAFAACGGSAKRSGDLLYDVRAFNEGLRWQKLPQSAVRIHPTEREAFLDEREQLQEELRIDDFEITRLKITGKSQNGAKVQIKWTWHMDRIGLVHTTTSKQEWRRFGERWIMLGEVHGWGDPMPGVPEAEDGQDLKQGSDIGNKGKAVKAGPGQKTKGQAKQSVEASLRATRKTSKISQ